MQLPVWQSCSIHTPMAKLLRTGAITAAALKSFKDRRGGGGGERGGGDVANLSPFLEGTARK